MWTVYYKDKPITTLPNREETIRFMDWMFYVKNINCYAKNKKHQVLTVDSTLLNKLVSEFAYFEG
ncbi:MAG: hypothetical protein J6X78_08765 [Treponema sp.]|nr:hypothetical protein [Treponema sp.]